MVRIGWNKRSLADLREIHDFIAKDSRFQATRVVRIIRAAVKRLHRFPESGAVVPEINQEAVREISVFNYRIIYRWIEATKIIRVLAIVHGARLFNDSLLDDPF